MPERIATITAFPLSRNQTSWMCSVTVMVIDPFCVKSVNGGLRTSFGPSLVLLMPFLRQPPRKRKLPRRELEN